MQHLDEGTIHAWLDGALPPEQAADVERHARNCAQCASLVADARGVIAGAARIVSALDDVPGGVIPARQAQTSTRSLWHTLRLTPFRAALAASLMLAVASLLVVRHTPEPHFADTTAASVAAPAAAAPALTSANEPADKATSVPATPERRRFETVAKAAPPRAPAPSAPAASVPAVAVSDSAAEARKSLAQLSEIKPTASPDSASLRTDPKARAVNKVALVPTSTQAAGAAGASRAADRDVVRKLESVQPGSQTVSLVAMTVDDRPVETPGCYQLVRDSVAVSPRIPERFSLDVSYESGARLNIVRAVNPAGRRDSVLAGVTWRLVPGSTKLVFISNESPLPLMEFRPRAADAGTFAPRRENSAIAKEGSLPRISRVDCR